MVEVVKYSAEYKQEWDGFVAGSKNGTFLLLRDYMEYHADRFQDHSLLFYRKGKLVAVLPANVAGEEIYSHAGLTYGGIISNQKMKVPVMLQVFESMRAYCHTLGFSSLYYKTIPHIFHRTPAEEDLYALFRNQAQLYRRDVGSAIALEQSIKYSKKRRWQVSKAQKYGMELGRSEDFARFMQIEQELLQERYNKQPVHTAAEMQRLASLFPDNIKLYTASIEGEILAGIIVYETDTVAHCQYIASTARGRSLFAPDALIDHLLTKVYPHKKYFNLGISTEQQGQFLNEGLNDNKESYGARAIVHDFYKLPL
ncbi:GNAT family N-acetyltransferase [Pontibacter ruber]|uniref:GNAT family N-acetyltransferase n=1 Tax=Pontibacter ruber TaxID=1343895 RepID=A0ABW5CYE4_9BACT|nr:GNAT family N-acetyltransferase [Pontibacter ruber]